MDSFEKIPKPPEHVVRYAMGLVSGPCIAMIILGFAVRVSELPRTVNGTGHTGPSEFCATSI